MNDRGGVLGVEKYHTREVCQVVFEGEFSLITVLKWASNQVITATVP